MKPSIERKKRYGAKLHQKRKYMNVHLSKELRLKEKKRALLVKKGDAVKVLRGQSKGKDAKVAKVNYNKGKVYLEGIAKKTARAREMPIAFDPSNLMIITMAERKAKVQKGENNGKKRTN